MKEKNIATGYNGYQLTDRARADLLARISPIHPDVIAHHVTHSYGVHDSLPPDCNSVRVVAVASDDLVQAAIVQVNGSSTRAYGNSFYHVTISIDRAAGGQAYASNALIKRGENWTVVVPFDIDVVPKFFKF